MSLTPILRTSNSADTLSCRRPLKKSGSDSALGLNCHRKGGPFCLHNPLLPLNPPNVAWRHLSAAIIDAFERCSDVSPDHPCMKAVEGLDAAALARDLAKHQNWMEGAYTRTTVLKGDGFEAMLLCWPPNTCSPVHAHSDAESGVKSNCFMAILEGELTETLYEPDEIDGSRVISFGQSRALPAGATAYINDDRGVHKVGNESLTTPAVSLHIYAPGWSTVQIYREEPTDAGGAPIDADGWGDF